MFRSNNVIRLYRQTVNRHSVKPPLPFVIEYCKTTSELTTIWWPHWHFVLCAVRRRLTWRLSLLALLTCLTGEGCDLHRRISLMFHPSACRLSAVMSFRLLVLRSGTAYQMMSPPLCPCQPSGAIWRHTYSAAVTTLSDTAVLTLTIVVLVVALLLRPL